MGPPVTRPATPSGPVDPFNCAVDPENTWAADKKEWCCRVHHRGCPPTAPPVQPIVPIMPIVTPACSLLGQRILTIAPMVSQIGRQVGQCRRRTGAAKSTARAARIKEAAV